MDGRKDSVTETWRGRLLRAAVAAGVLAVLALGQSGRAQDDAPPPESPPAEAAEPAQAETPEQAARPRRDAEDDVFVPTEEIAADEEIVFPVDI